MADGTDDDAAQDIGRLAETAPDDAARKLRKLSKRKRARAAQRIAAERRGEVLDLAEQAPGTAGALMTSRYADLPADVSAADAIQRLAAEREAETIYTAYVVDSERRLLGEVTLRALLEAPKQTPVQKVMTPSPAKALTSDRDEVTARAMVEDGALTRPVVDEAGRLVGIITHDDADACLGHAIEDDRNRFSAIVGRPPEARYLDVSLTSEFARRAPWIFTLAVAGLLSGYIVHAYEDALDALVILALYMPMVADSGGNVGTQSASLVLRALATGQIALGVAWRVIWKETRVALALAAMLFLFAYLKVLFLSNNADVPFGLRLDNIALAIAVALAVCVFVSTLLGAILPLVATLFRVDPAVVAGPALTTLVDVVGLLIYFQITSSLLGLNLIVSPTGG